MFLKQASTNDPGSVLTIDNEGVVAGVLQLVFDAALRGKSGGERAALQTLREIRERQSIAPAFGVRWL
jgi:hypothetical protein